MQLTSKGKRCWAAIKAKQSIALDRTSYDFAEEHVARHEKTGVRKARAILRDIKQGKRAPYRVGHNAALTIDSNGRWAIVQNWFAN